jgi:ribonucleoside-diphosphate reductase alpha chain
MNTLINAVAIQKTGGGNGFSFGRLRPARSIVSTSRGEATGPVGFLGMYNANFEHIRQGGSRRGANMGVLPVWHPDVLKFIFAKVNEGQNANFNISVGLTRKFMEAVKAGDDWEFRFPGPEGPVQEVEWNGEMIKSMPAAELFDIITTNAHKLGDPGALFLDQANDFNPCPKYYVLETTNPCGEQWLGPYENCCLGSIAMSYFVNEAGSFDWAVFQKYVELATEFLDDVVDANTYVESVPQLEEAAQGGRRIGMGQMGLHDALLLQGLRYGRSDGEEFASQVTEFMSYHTMLTSIRRAYARGAFPRIGESIYDPALLKEKGEGATFEGTMTDGTTPFVGRLWSRPTPIISHETDFGRPECDWDNVFEGIVAHGIRNSCQRTFAPTGTIATTAGMEGYGCEPLFALFYIRTVMQEREQIELVYPSQLFLQALTKAGITDEDELVQIAERVKANNGSCQGVEGVPLSIQDIFVVAGDLSGVEHVRMQAVLQAFVDNSISKTINFPKEATIADVAEVYLQAYELGCKGVTIYRQGSRKLEVLSTGAKTGEVEVIDKGHWPLISPLPIPVEAESDGMPSRTYTARTPFGKMRAVFTELEEFPGRPFDIQLSIGRGGSDVNAFTEAIGRLTSLALRAGVPAEAIADQLIGIGGSTQEATLRPDKALSLPDGFGKLMVQHANRESKVVVVEPQKVHDPGLLCPDCNKATVVVAVGCKTCLPELGGCGWSKC